MISKKEAEDFIEELALASSISEDDISDLRERIPSKNPHITPLLEELVSTYFLTDEVLEYYSRRLYRLVNT